MFRTFLFFVFFAAFSANAANDEFCKGFKKGYITGYKQASKSPYDPYPPYCPTQPMKQYNDPESDFEHGYVIGYERGQAVGRR